VVPGSGNQWHSALDVRANGFLYSCKYTDQQSYRITRDTLDEMTLNTMGPGKEPAIPALAVRLGETSGRYDFVVVGADDWKNLIEHRHAE
jgi:hypothetical protein